MEIIGQKVLFKCSTRRYEIGSRCKLYRVIAKLNSCRDFMHVSFLVHLLNKW